MAFKAKSDFVYAGRRVKAGETVAMTASHARLFKALGHVENYDEPAQPRASEPDPLDHDENGRKGGSKKGSKRNYKRRDMRAED